MRPKGGPGGPPGVQVAGRGRGLRLRARISSRPRQRQQGMVTPDPHLVTSLELEAEAADDDASWWPLISSCCLHQMVDNTQNRVFSFCKIVHVILIRFFFLHHGLLLLPARLQSVRSGSANVSPIDRSMSIDPFQARCGAVQVQVG